ncbi:glycerate kinase [Haloferula rosea]|uniref:Glycerate kinase n=1 Tax=Haloferula rosea TaxID=490093 RepID=A0A934VF66_9BACT|nr:glycerate kinase [Haloferula rosea]MBK1828049.1 glycerate kinase [Haloferula rosea]
MTRRILIAPDKFKGSLTAIEAANSIAEGVRRIDPLAEFDLCPIADGGEGFMEAVAKAMKADWVHCEAVDALGRPINSRYVLAGSSGERIAVLEMAETAGLWRLHPSEYNPLKATTRGVGMQMAHAILQHSVDRIILGLGGSATNDAGCGMASALGVRFLDHADRELGPIPSDLQNLANIDADSIIGLPAITAACDVDNPLLGPRGATSVFSAQKGADPPMKQNLERSITRLVEAGGASDIAACPGAGAAGGLGFGLMFFAGARLVSGFDLLADLLHLDSRIQAADHVITGEGSIDHQSLSGKGPVGLARMARKRHKPVTAFCGIADQAARDSGEFDGLHALTSSGLPLKQLIEQAAPLLIDLVANSDTLEP